MFAALYTEEVLPMCPLAITVQIVNRAWSVSRGPVTAPKKFGVK